MRECLSAGLESARVLNWHKSLPEQVLVFLGLAGDGVGDPEDHAQVGEAGGKDPVAVEARAAGVEDFGDDFDVLLIEEPKIARVRSELDGVARIRGAGNIGPQGFDPESALLETWSRIGRSTGVTASCLSASGFSVTYSFVVSSTWCSF